MIIYCGLFSRRNAVFKFFYVLVKIQQTDPTRFKGIFIQARIQGSTTAIGSFTVQVGDDHLKTVDCGGNSKVRMRRGL